MNHKQCVKLRKKAYSINSDPTEYTDMQVERTRFRSKGQPVSKGPAIVTVMRGNRATYQSLKKIFKSLPHTMKARFFEI